MVKKHIGTTWKCSNQPRVFLYYGYHRCPWSRQHHLRMINKYGNQTMDQSINSSTKPANQSIKQATKTHKNTNQPASQSVSQWLTQCLSMSVPIDRSQSIWSTNQAINWISNVLPTCSELSMSSRSCIVWRQIEYLTKCKREELSAFESFWSVCALLQSAQMGRDLQGTRCILHAFDCIWIRHFPAVNLAVWIWILAQVQGDLP